MTRHTTEDPWRLSLNGTFDGRYLTMVADIDGRGDVPAMRLDPGCDGVSFLAGDGAPMPFLRRGDRLLPHGDPPLPIRLRYRFPMPCRLVMLPDDLRLARPDGAFRVTAWHCAASGGAGIAARPDPGGGMPSMVLWPPHDRPGLLLDVRGRAVTPGEGWIAREVSRAVSYLTDLLGPMTDTTVVDVAERGALAYSRPGLVTVHPRLLAHVATLTLQFLPHELAHQWFGNRVRFAGPGFLWPRECLPELIQHRYLARRTNRSAADRIARRYTRPDHVALLHRLFTLAPGDVDALPETDYHAVLAAGTRLWLDIADALAPRVLTAVLRDLATGDRELTAAAVAERLRAARDPRVDALLAAHLTGARV